jgi:replicative DNA helicase
MKEVEALILNALEKSNKSLITYAITVFSEEDFITKEGKECFQKFASEIEKGLRPRRDCNNLPDIPFVFEDEEHIRGLKELLSVEKLKEEIHKFAEAIEKAQEWQEIKSEAEYLFSELVATDRQLNKTEEIYKGTKLEELVEEIIKESEDISFIVNEFTTGLESLDGKISLNREQLLVIGARPGVGKTQFALKIAKENALRGKKVMFFSLEMSAKQLIERLLSMGAKIPAEHIQRRNLTEEDKEKIRNFVSLVKDSLVIVEGSRSLSEIVLLSKAEKPDMVIVDYLQIVKGRANQKEYERITETTQGLKRLAVDEKLFVVALAQVNRESEKGADKHPTLANLKGSGQIEQDADTVIFLHSPELSYKQKGKEVPEDLKNKMELIVAKNRHKGFLGILPFRKNPVTGELEELTPQIPEEFLNDLNENTGIDLEDLDLPEDLL